MESAFKRGDFETAARDDGRPLRRYIVEHGVEKLVPGACIMFDDDIGLRLLWAAGGDFRDTAITASFIGGNVEALDYLLQLGRAGDPSVRRLHYSEMEEFPEWLMHSDIGSESSFVYSDYARWYDENRAQIQALMCSTSSSR